jgi:hypothetical protein
MSLLVVVVESTSVVDAVVVDGSLLISTSEDDSSISPSHSINSNRQGEVEVSTMTIYARRTTHTSNVDAWKQQKMSPVTRSPGTKSIESTSPPPNNNTKYFYSLAAVIFPYKIRYNHHAGPAFNRRHTHTRTHIISK